ncbi:MAG: sodium:glutamate symporter [Cyanobacteria bacterium P01_A01_bin.45]
MLKLADVFWAYILIAISLLLGRFIRQRISILRSLFIPSSVVAGIIALLLGKGALGAIVAANNPASPLANGLFSEAIINTWKQSPGIFINIVFATLFLGQTIPGFKKIWQQASPQAAFGQVLGWGQYVVGLLLTITVLTPVFKLPPIVASLIEIGFEGGHGTAGGMKQTFADLNFPAGADLSLTLATVGLVSGIISGTFLMNWGRNTGKITITRNSEIELGIGENEESIHTNTPESPDIKDARKSLFRDLLIDPISLNFSFVGLGIGIGWIILESLRLFESLTWGKGEAALQVMKYVPLFPMALIGGILVQILLMRTNRQYMVSRPLMERIGGLALDIVIVTGLATISLQALSANLPALLILAIAGISWNIFVYIFLAPRLIPVYPYERGLGDLGQSMGVTATGILLLRMVDPDNRSGAFECFAYKQLLFEPILGGGLFTGIAPTLINNYGALPILGLTSVILIVWLVFGFWNCKQLKKVGVDV